MNGARQRGTTLVVGLVLLSLVTLLGLAGASTAHVERQLAQNEQFRENAATAASAGIETAISQIVNTSVPSTVPATARGSLYGPADHFETLTRFTGYETSLPQMPGAALAGAHFEITSTGYSARHAVDRQRAQVMWVLATSSGAAADCAPVVPVHCYQPGELVRLSWQRVALD